MLASKRTGAEVLPEEYLARGRGVAPACAATGRPRSLALTPDCRHALRYDFRMNVSRLAEAWRQSDVARRVRTRKFVGSAAYWESRYASGGTSGTGSYGLAAEWKADVVNRWVADTGTKSVVDLGCGDGNQLKLAKYPRYLGLDRSASAIRRCIRDFAGDDSKSFIWIETDATADPAGWLRGDMALSLEVIFHLVEDEARTDYLRRLFASGEKFVVICSTDGPVSSARPHERHEAFTPWVEMNASDWELLERVAPPSEANLLSDLFLYGRRS